MQAKQVYDLMVKTLEEKEWKFQEHADELLIVSNYHGDDIPIDFLITIDEKREVIQFLSPLPFKFGEDKRIDGALAVCSANYGMVNGSFDYNIEDGALRFRLTTSFTGNEIGPDFFMNMMAIACATTDRYNDRFMMLAKGMISLVQFMKMEE